MRLIEIKTITNRIVNNNKQVEVFNKPLYGNTAFEVEKLDDYIKFLYIMSEFSFSGIKKAELDDSDFVKNRINNNILDANQFNILVSFTNRLNGTLPIFYSIMESLVKDQDPYLLNIKLPENVKKLSDVSSFNNKISEIFKKFDYGTDEDNFLLIGLDKGSEWYEILLSKDLFDQVIFSLDTASRFLGWWEVFKISKDFILNKNIYNQNVKKDESSEGKDYEYVIKNEWIKNYISDNIKNIENKGKRTDSEIISKIMMGTNDLISLMENGSELRISYNPPEYIQTNKNFFEIDYKKLSINKDNQIEKNEIKNIESPKIEKSEDDKENIENK